MSKYIRRFKSNLLWEVCGHERYYIEKDYVELEDTEEGEAEI